MEINLLEVGMSSLVVRKGMMFLLVVIMLVLLASGVAALGVTPARTTVDFEPGLTQTISFDILNSENKDINLVLAVQGELKNYVQVHENQVAMTQNEGSRSVSYTVVLPSSLEPGDHKAEIVAAKCMGCGICASECPARAIQLNHFEAKHFNSMLDDLFSFKGEMPN